MVTHDPNAASYADLVCFLADGRGVDTLAHPNAAQVSARMITPDERKCVSGMLKLIWTQTLARRGRLAMTVVAVSWCSASPSSRAPSCSPTPP